MLGANADLFINGRRSLSVSHSVVMLTRSGVIAGASSGLGCAPALAFGVRARRRHKRHYGFWLTGGTLGV